MPRLSTSNRLRHDAVRDTHWVGKGIGSPWWVFIVMALIAGAIVYFVGR